MPKPMPFDSIAFGACTVPLSYLLDWTLVSEYGTPSSPPFWIASSVPSSTTEYPLVSDPILTNLYCAASCSCSVGACAVNNTGVTIDAAINSIVAVNFPNPGDVIEPSVRFLNFEWYFETLRRARSSHNKIKSRQTNSAYKSERERRGRRSPILIPSCLLLLRSASRRCRSLCLHLRFGLVGLLLLVLQGLSHGGIRRRRRHIRRCRPRIRRRRHAVRTLLLRHFAHAGGDGLLEVVVHFLEVIHLHGHGLTRGAIALLGRRDAGIHGLIR